jgi:DNA-binding PadR family transcriptional regulator
MNHEFHEHNHDERSRRTRGPRDRRSPGGRFGGPDEMGRGAFAHRGGRRLRRGDVRAAVLVLLEESPRNGYQIIQELSDRSNGAWRPSPGSVYPILQQLEDEGLIAVVANESGRTFNLTEQGRALVASDRDKLGKPWETAAAGVNGASSELFSTLKQVAMAVRQVAFAGSESQTEKAAAALADARRTIYRILADDES